MGVGIKGEESKKVGVGMGEGRWVLKGKEGRKEERLEGWKEKDAVCCIGHGKREVFFLCFLLSFFFPCFLLVFFLFLFLFLSFFLSFFSFLPLFFFCFVFFLFFFFLFFCSFLYS